MQVTISDMVRQRRGNQNVRAAAAEIGISHQTLRALEAGRLPARASTMRKVADWLGQETTALLGLLVHDPKLDFSQPRPAELGWADILRLSRRWSESGIQSVVHGGA